MTLNAFLHENLPSPCFQRPFVCEGRPESCTVLIVGESPATSLNTNWWTFWNDDLGFNLKHFECIYENSRLKAGRKAVSNTRLRLNRLRIKHNLRCLETNAFTKEQPAGHNASFQNDLLDHLLKLRRLRAVIIHGEVARKTMSNVKLPSRLERFEVSHFRSLAYEKLDKIAHSLK